MRTLSFQEKCISLINKSPNYAVFFFFDLLDDFLCIVFRFLDEVMEDQLESCHCKNLQENLSNNQHLSETLYTRRNIFRQAGFLRFAKKLPEISKKIGIVTFLRKFIFPKKTKSTVLPREFLPRWSDCDCKTCVSSTNNDKLNVIVMQPSISQDLLMIDKPVENVIFIHGFLSSSTFWTGTVFKHFPRTGNTNYKFFAVDLLGFGDSPKPRDSHYSLKEHVEMIEKSVILPNDLTTFHVVAHSMGCIIAVALAAKFPHRVKSVTLVAPPYFPDSEREASCYALDVIAEKKLWPPASFVSSMMAWYEHIGRAVCFVVCKHHRTWEKIIKIVTWKRKLPTSIMELTKHTHRSAWHSVHNVICAGAKFTDKHLETLINSDVKIYVVQGDKDAIVPLECMWNMKAKFPAVEIEVVTGTDHATVITSRRQVFIAKLVSVWEETKLMEMLKT